MLAFSTLSPILTASIARSSVTAWATQSSAHLHRSWRNRKARAGGAAQGPLEMLPGGRDLHLNLDFLPRATDSLSWGWKMEIIVALTVKFVVKWNKRAWQVHGPGCTQNWYAQAGGGTLVIKSLSQVFQGEQLLLHRRVNLGSVVPE